MQTIHKYPIEITDSQEVMLPDGARILTVQLQHGQACLWALVESENPLKPRRILSYGTGHPVSDSNMQYISTIQIEGSSLVFHFFSA